MQTTINNNKYYTYFKKQLYRLVIVLAVLVLNGPELFTVGRTSAFYNDTEISNNNIIKASELDFILDEKEWIPTVSEFDLEEGKSISRTITIAEDLNTNHSIDFKYIVTPLKTNGDNDFCSALQLKASLGGISQYEGPLFNFTSKTSKFDYNNGDWIFNISLLDDPKEFTDKSCNFDFVFSGWQIQFSNEGGGYNDVERSTNIIVSGGKSLRSDTILDNKKNKQKIKFVSTETYDITLTSTIKTRDIIDTEEEQLSEKIEDGLSISKDVKILNTSNDGYKDNSNILKTLCTNIMPEEGNLEDNSSFINPREEVPIEDKLLTTYETKEDSKQTLQDISTVGTPLDLWIPDLSKINKISNSLSVD